MQKLAQLFTRAEFERGDHAEVAAAALQRLKQLERLGVVELAPKADGVNGSASELVAEQRRQAKVYERAAPCPPARRRFNSDLEFA